MTKAAAPLLRLVALVLFAAALSVTAARAGAPARPAVVVELFTSQGCSSCPPADAYLGELAKQPDILALSMHIDYWNGLGWPDPYSNAEVTARQRAYARALGGHYVYTPEMIVAGRKDAVGSERATVARLIATARAKAGGGPDVSLSEAGGKLTVSVGAAPFKGQATVWWVAFDNGHTTKVRAGENGGRTLSYVNVVRDLRAIGSWSGEATRITVDIADELREGYQNCAILVQADGTGPILAAAAIPMVKPRP